MYLRPYGQIKSAWTATPVSFDLDVTIPANATSSSMWLMVAIAAMGARKKFLAGSAATTDLCWLPCIRWAVLAFLQNGTLGRIGKQALGGEPDPDGSPVAGDGSQHFSGHAGRRDDTGWTLHQHDHQSAAVSFGDRHG